MLIESPRFTTFILYIIIYYVKRFTRSLILSVLVILCAACALIACAPVSTITVLDMELLSSPDRSYFLVGEELDLTGARVKVTYEGNVIEEKSLVDIADRLEIKGFDSSSRTFSQTVSVYYQDVYVDFVVDIVEESDLLTLTFVDGQTTSSFSVIAGKTVSSYVSQEAIRPSSDYYFEGWYTSTDNGQTLVEKLDFSSAVYESATYYPRWQTIISFVSTSYNGNTDSYTVSSVENSYVDVGDSLTESEFDSVLRAVGFSDKAGSERAVKIAPDGIAGLSHYDVEALSDAWYGDYYQNLTENKTVYLFYIPDLVKVYFDFNGATAIRKPHDPTGTVDFLTETRGDYAGMQYLEFPYSKQLDLPEIVDVGKVIDEGDVAPDGSTYAFSYRFEFSGWYLDETYSDSSIYDGQALSGDLVLHARWQWTLWFYTGDEGVINKELLEPLYLDEGVQFSYSDLPDIPETFSDSTGATVRYIRDDYSSWWSFKTGKTGSAREYADIIPLDGTYYLDDCVDSLTDKAVVYACFYRIPYHISFDPLSDSVQQESISNGVDTYYGENLRAYSNANGVGDFERWYVDKQLLSPVVYTAPEHDTDPRITTVSGTVTGYYGASVVDSDGVVLINGSAYYIRGGNAYLHNPDYDSSAVAVGNYSDGTLNIDGVDYVLSEQTLEPSSGSMTLYAGYTIKATFRVNKFSQNSTYEVGPVKRAYVSDGVYRADISSLVPAAPSFDGYESYWLRGSLSGEPDATALNEFESNGTLPDFTAIDKQGLVFVAHPVLKSYSVRYVLNTQTSTDLADVYLDPDYALYLDGTYTSRVMHGTSAPFFDSDKLLVEGTPSDGISEWYIDGYYLDSDFGREFSFDTPIEQAYTLYAKWMRKGTVGIVYDDDNNVVGFDIDAYRAHYGETNSNELKVLVVPHENNSLPVTTILGEAFLGYTSLTDIYVASSVTSIKQKAFRGCTALNNLHTFYEMINLGVGVFDDTAWLTSATAEAKQSDGKVIFNGNQLYKYVGTASELSIGGEDGIRIIGYSALEYNSTVTSLTLDGSILAIRPYAFSGMSVLETVSVSGNSMLRRDLLDTRAFYDLQSLVSISVSGDNYRSIDGVLYRLDGGREVELIVYPSAKTDSALVIPSTVNYIGNYAFGENSSLSALVFTSSVAPALQGSKVFNGLLNLDYLVVGTDPTYQGEDLGEYWKDIFNTLYRDKIRYNKVNIEYVSEYVEVLSTPTTSSYVYGTTLGTYIPTAEHAEFSDWYLDEDRTVRWDNRVSSWTTYLDLTTASFDGKSLTTPLKLYADWTGTISYEAADGSTVTETVRLGTVLPDDIRSALSEMLSAPIYNAEGYTAAWQFSDGTVMPLDAPLTRGGAVTIVQSLNRYTVDYKYYDYVDGESVDYATVTVNHGETVSVPSPVHRDINGSSIIFGGWYRDEATSTDRFLSTDQVTSDLVLYARWNIKITTVYLYDGVGGTETAGETIAVLYNRAGTTPAAPKVRGYSYKWYYSDGSDLVEYGSSTVIDREYILYAVYSKLQYTITFEVGGYGTAPSTQTVEYGDKVAYPDMESIVGDYAFAGWYTDNTYETQYDFSLGATESLTLYAYWVTNSKNLLDYTLIDSSNYGVTGSNIKDSVVYIPSSVYKFVKAYSVYKTKSADGTLSDMLSNSVYEEGNYSLTIGDPDDDLYGWAGGATTYYADGSTLYGDYSHTNAVGTVDTRNNIMQVTVHYSVGTQTIDYVYYVDLTTYVYNVVEIEGSRVKTILESAFSGNDSVRHLIIPDSVTEIKANAFDNMPSLEKFTVLPDNRVYFYIGGYTTDNQPVWERLYNCNGTYASIDGVLYQLGSGKITLTVDGEEGYGVSLEKIIKFPALLNKTTYTLELSRFSVKNNAVGTIDPNGIAISRGAFEGVEYLKNLRLRASSAPELGVNAFNGVGKDFKIFVGNKSVFLGGSWAAYSDMIYPDTVNIDYINPLDDSVLFSDVKTVFETADELNYDATIVFEGRQYTFGGWATSEDTETLFDFSTVLIDDIRIYARLVISGTKGLEFTKVTFDGETAYSVGIGTATADEIVIPNFYDGLPVRVVASGAFMSSGVRSVYIPATVREIKSTAFFGAKSLESVVIDADNLSYRSVDGVIYTYDLEKLVLYPAAMETDTTSYVIPDTTLTIGRAAFYGNKYLTFVSIPDSVTSIEYSAFGAMSKLSRLEFDGTLPPTLTADIFYGTSESLLILVPGKEGGDEYVEAYRSAWTGYVPASRISSIGAKTVYVYFMVEAREEDFEVYSVGSALYGELLSQVVTSPSRDGYAFMGWYDEPYLGGNRFSFDTDYIYKDTRLYARWAKANSADDGIVYVRDENSSAATVYVDKDNPAVMSLTKIVIASQWTIDGITYMVTAVSDDAFSGMTSLKEVILPATIISIGERAFYGCSSLSSVTLPATGLTSIGASAFEDCSSLRSVVIPSTIGTISDSLFKGCINLDDLIIRGSLVSIGDNAFTGCSSLKNIDLKDILESIGSKAFKNCTSLTSVSLPSTLNYIGESAFEGCRALERVDVAEGCVLRYTYLDDAGNSHTADGLGSSAFRDCIKLKSFVIPSGLTNIPSGAFYNCASLTSIVIPEDVSSIGVSAFENCTNLSSVTFADDIALLSIGARAFARCASLESITLPFTYERGKTSMGINIFIDSVNLVKVVILCSDGSGEYVLPSAAIDEDDMFLVGADSALIYVAGDKLSDYRNSSAYSAYSDRIRPIYSSLTYYTSDTTRYKQYVNYTDDIVAYDNIPESPEPSSDELVFGGWGYKTSGYSGLTLFDFATGMVKEGGLNLYAIWIRKGTPGLAYSLSFDGTIQVSQGSISGVENLVIANYYLYNGKYLPVTSISSGLIRGTSVSTVYIPETVTRIREDAFVGCNTLMSFIVAADNTSFKADSDALYSYDKKQLLSVPAGVGEGSSYEFVILSSVTTVTEYTFESARNISSFRSSSNYFRTENGVLYNSDSTTLIAYPAAREATTYTLPATVTTIYSSALKLSSSTGLNNFVVAEGNTRFVTEDGILYRLIGDKYELVRYPVGKDGGSDGIYYLDVDKVSVISDYAFRYVRNIRGLGIVSDTVIEIGEGAFDDADFYVLVPYGAFNSFKISSGYSDFVDRLITLTSVLTFVPGNGDPETVVDASTLSDYPDYPHRDPFLPYSSHGDWYFFRNGVKVYLTADTSEYVLNDVTLYLDWEVKNGTQGLQYVINDTGDGYEVSRGSAQPSDDGTIIVPTYYGGLPVVAIADRGFEFVPASESDLPGIRTLVLPSTLTRIGVDALKGETALLNLVMLSTTAVEIATEDKDPLKVIDEYRVAVNKYTKENMYFYVRSDSAQEYKKSWPSLTIRSLEGTIVFKGVTADNYKFNVLDGTLPDLSSLDFGQQEGDTVELYRDVDLTVPYTADAITRGTDNVSVTVYVKIISNQEEN